MKTKTVFSIDWAKITCEEEDIIRDIVKRGVALAMKHNLPVNKIDLEMDIKATHISCPLRLGDLLKADDGNFGHDIFGVQRYLNRETGELGNCFLPRFAAPSKKKASAK